MRPYPLLIIIGLLCPVLKITAQTKTPIKFGKITPADFIIKEAFDSSASAVVIADVGSSEFEGNIKGWFSLVYKRTTRIKILDQKGFDAAKVEIALYSDGSAEEKLDDLKAFTYNLENGKVVGTRLEASSIFKEKRTKNYLFTKFTLPAVKEGSVIEYSYTVKSDFLYNLKAWYFQSQYPCLWSEYEVGIPEFFNYVTLSQGYLQPEFKSNTQFANFKITVPGGADQNQNVALDGTVYYKRWVVKNSPAIKLEKYTSALKNYISGVEFQLSSYQFQGQMPHDQMGNWILLGQKLMQNEYFGLGLSKNNNWLDDDIKVAVKDARSKLEKAKKIFAYVRDNMTCTDNSAIYLGTTVKEAYKKHSGTVADINLLLIAMLRHENITADPVILSTRENGFTSEVYPLIQRFNYVICGADIDGAYYNLDASNPYNGFSRLPANCYNGHARVITKEAAMPVYFSADSLNEKKMTTVFISNDEKSGLTGSFRSQLGYYESLDLRGKLKGDQNGYFKKVKSSFSFDMSVRDAGIDSLKLNDMPALIHYDFAFKPADDENIVYFNPMLSEAYKENPFTSADRIYPVEMPYTMDETYMLNMEVPNGFTVEEIPKSVKVAFNDDEGLFEYLVQKSDGAIQLRSRIKLNKANFTPEDYTALRDFFGFIVKKQGEQIVLKKK
ncbi:MAG: DUF3858 domain-containing protein [Chitinophagaceae bacterium]